METLGKWKYKERCLVVVYYVASLVYGGEERGGFCEVILAAYWGSEMHRLTMHACFFKHIDTLQLPFFWLFLPFLPIVATW